MVRRYLWLVPCALGLALCFPAHARADGPDAAESGAEAASDRVEEPEEQGSAWAQFKRGVKDAIHGIGEGARSVGHAVRDGAKEVGHKTAAGAKEVGHGARDVGKKIGSGAKEAGQKAGQTAGEAGHEIGQGAKELGQKAKEEPT